MLPGIQHTPLCWVRNAAGPRSHVDYPAVAAAIPGAEHDRAGIALRSKAPNNYYLLRAVSLEKRGRIYKVEHGKRSTLAGRNLEVAVDQWHTLALTARGDLFTVYFNGREPFSHRDRAFRHAGAFGLWSKPNNLTYINLTTFKADNSS